MVDNGTTQAPARSPPMKVSRYSIELVARMAILSPRPTPMVESERAIRLMRLSNARHVRVSASHMTAIFSGQASALRATRTGIETKSGKSSSVGCGTRAVSGLMATTLFLGLDLFDRSARLLPGAEAAFEVRDRCQPHVLRRLGGDRRPPGAGAQEDELVAGLEIVLGVGTLGIDPHLEHAACDVDGARDRAVARHLARIADVDELDARLPI